MRFVPVPIIGGPTVGKNLLFSVWETRVQDYAAFAKLIADTPSRVETLLRKPASDDMVFGIDPPAPNPISGNSKAKRAKAGASRGKKRKST